MTPETSAKREKTIAIVALVAVVIIAAAVAFYQSSKGSEGTVTDTPSQSTNQTSATNQTTTNSDSNSSSSTTYKDGTYTATGTYRTPEGTESVEVTLTIANNVVTNSEVTTSGNNRESVEYQSQFKNNYKQYVVGKNLADISLSRVSGSSLTPNGFNQALDDIRSQAQA